MQPAMRGSSRTTCRRTSRRCGPYSTIRGQRGRHEPCCAGTEDRTSSTFRHRRFVRQHRTRQLTPYIARQSGFHMQVTRCGLSEATSVIALSYHSAGAIAEDSPELEKKTGALPGGVDSGLFRPTPSMHPSPGPSSGAPVAIPERRRGCARSSTDSPTGGIRRERGAGARRRSLGAQGGGQPCRPRASL